MHSCFYYLLGLKRLQYFEDIYLTKKNVCNAVKIDRQGKKGTVNVLHKNFYSHTTNKYKKTLA